MKLVLQIICPICGAGVGEECTFKGGSSYIYIEYNLMVSGEVHLSRNLARVAIDKKLGIPYTAESLTAYGKIEES